jgi:hypothetical protein
VVVFGKPLSLLTSTRLVWIYPGEALNVPLHGPGSGN